MVFKVVPEPAAAAILVGSVGLPRIRRLGVRPVSFAEPSGDSEAWRSLRTTLGIARDSVADAALSPSLHDLAQPHTTPPVTGTEEATLGVILL